MGILGRTVDGSSSDIRPDSVSKRLSTVPIKVPVGACILKER